jgi:D-xylose transport system substrate-binding protein
LEEVSKQVGVDLRVQIANKDAAKQVSQCENLLSQGVKVLIVAPQDASSAAVIVEKAHKANVPVISYDRMIMNCDVDVYLSFDNEKVGELQAEWLTRKVPKGNYVILKGAPTDNNVKLLYKGNMKYVQPLIDKGDVKVVFEQFVKDWNPSEAQRLMEQALTANNNKVDAVLAENDGTGGGAVQALAAQGLAGKVPVTGQDAELSAAIRIVKGLQGMTVFKDTRLLGEEAINIALKMVSGQPIIANSTVANGYKDVPSVLLTPFQVDKDNIDEVLIESGYLKRSDVYK